MNAAPSRPPAEHWTLDKRIPIAFLIGLAAQAGVVIWYAAKFDARLTTSERAIESMLRVDDQFRATDGAHTVQMNAIGDRTTRLEVDYGSSKAEISRRLGSIEDKLDRLVDSQSGLRSRSGPASGGQPDP
jgi:hypothetical protein